MAGGVDTLLVTYGKEKGGLCYTGFIFSKEKSLDASSF